MGLCRGHEPQDLLHVVGQLLGGQEVGSKKSASLTGQGKGGHQGALGTHCAGHQLPVENLSPGQHVLHAQLHGQFIDVLWEGRVRPPARMHATTPSPASSSVPHAGDTWREDGWGWPSWGY